MDIGIFALIKNEEGKILLVKDVSRQKLWTLPGGGAEFKELLPDTLIRELKEEASVEIAVGQLLGIFSQQKSPGIVVLFEAKHLSGNPTPDGAETSECKFFSLEELLEIREQVKPAQLSMVWQVSKTNEYPIFNSFPAPESHD
jgi:ADP-ribose pyrophosphatase YjhB (NUDIX family)